MLRLWEGTVFWKQCQSFQQEDEEMVETESTESQNQSGWEREEGLGLYRLSEKWKS